MSITVPCSLWRCLLPTNAEYALTNPLSPACPACWGYVDGYLSSSASSSTSMPSLGHAAFPVHSRRRPSPFARSLILECYCSHASLQLPHGSSSQPMLFLYSSVIVVHLHQTYSAILSMPQAPGQHGLVRAHGSCYLLPYYPGPQSSMVLPRRSS